MTADMQRVSEATAAHKDVIRRLYEEFFTDGLVEVAGELMTEDYVNHAPSPGAGPSRDDLKGAVVQFHQTLLGFRSELIRTVAEDDLVATQGVFRGVTASGETTTIKIIDLFRFEHRRIAERRG